MKTKFEEGKWGCEIVLIPETPAETAQLLRVAKNTKREPAYISFSFFTDEPKLSVSMNKVNEGKQYDSINNKKS